MSAAQPKIWVLAFLLTAAPATGTTYTVRTPWLKTSHPDLNNAYRIAIGDLLGNVSLFQAGLLEEPAPVFLAGQGYRTPWTRDAAINAWNGASIVAPEVARNTLRSVVARHPEGPRVIGEDQYWDAIVWVTGAWRHYLYTGDREFLQLAFQVARNSLRYYEDTEYDEADGLFRGPGWSDGVAGYPDAYADAGGHSGINRWPEFNPDRISRPGFGIPMKALSTNSLYYQAYRLLPKMAAELGIPGEAAWARQAERLRQAIQRHFWNAEAGHYRFLTGPFGVSDHQEALGHAYVLLFGIAGEDQARSVLARQYVAPAGVPCLWPNLERYQRPGGMSFGRHAGTVWPQIQGMWAHAAALHGRAAIFGHELFQLAAHALRDNHFAEIYHPLTGEIYGGLQERDGQGIVLWQAQPRQTWAATAYLRMVLFGLAGLRIAAEGVRFAPCVPEGVSRVEITGLHLRDRVFSVTVSGTGCQVREWRADGARLEPGGVIPWDAPRRRVAVTVTVE
jgi:glycogen debranching enzyme